ncbi:MAG TPA: ion channel [Terriglobales bacterium]|nr:ion channel [Terriglobales bacterium]
MFWAVLGCLLVAIVLWEAFETIVLPRRVTRRFRLTRGFYRATWRPWRWLALRVRKRRRRDALLSIYGPLSLIFLLIFWAVGLLFGFALLQYGFGSQLKGEAYGRGLWTDLYLSGTTLFTLGLGDVVPVTTAGRALVVLEASFGFGFFALVIGYLPVLYQSFSRREVNISLLDARAGSPPTAAELLRRHAQDNSLSDLRELLYEWERWAADLLESAISYPVLCYFRSQHDNQSWLGALTTILDTCSLTMVGIDGMCARQAQLTFAMARHAVVDLAQVFSTTPKVSEKVRLPPNELVRLRGFLANAGLSLHASAKADQRLAELRSMYEPYVFALSDFLALPVPEWIAHEDVIDNWKTSAWGRISGSTATAATRTDDHF